MKEIPFEYESCIYTFLVGENKYENFEIIDESDETDIWFHVENEPSCHVILKNENNVKMHDIPKQVIRNGVYLCKIHSKSSKSKKTSIMYTFLKYVKKTTVIGQVTVSNYWTIEM